MDEIQAMLDRLSELSTEELETLQASIVSTFNALDKTNASDELMDQVTTLASAATAVNEEKAHREVKAAEFQAAVEAAVLAITGPKETKAPVVEETAETIELSAETPVEAELTTNPDEDVPGHVVKPLDSTPAKHELKQPEVTVNTDPTNIDEPVVTPPAAAVEDLKTPATPVVEEEKVEEEEEIPHDDEVVEEAPVEEVSEETHTEETPDKEEDTTVTAAAANGGEQLTVVAPADRQPEVPSAAVTITAGADVPGITVGTSFPDALAVGDAFVKTLHAIRTTNGGDGVRHTIASLAIDYPEDRKLNPDDAQANSKKINNVVSPEAIVAGGGLCAPVAIRYELFGLGDNGRPVRDSLAVFSADRGGIQFVSPPLISDLNGAVSVWTVQNDIDAATVGAPDPTKPCIRVACGGKVEVDTEAIPLCLTFGNLVSRTYPELVARHMELGMIWHSRFAEQRLLTRIGALSTAVTQAKKLGASRDFFVALDTAAVSYRNRWRMADDEPLRVMLPTWFKGVLRADFVMQIPGDGPDDTFGLTDATVNSWFAVRNINVTWFWDGETGQIAAAQTAGALNGFPGAGTMIWYLFAEGTFLFLDGGTLDLGLVRDSTLNSTNDYQMFLETFEGVAKVGIESLKITSTLQVNGSTAATTVTNT